MKVSKLLTVKEHLPGAMVSVKMKGETLYTLERLTRDLNTLSYGGGDAVVDSLESILFRIKRDIRQLIERDSPHSGKALINDYLDQMVYVAELIKFFAKYRDISEQMAKDIKSYFPLDGEEEEEEEVES